MSAGNDGKAVTAGGSSYSDFFRGMCFISLVIVACFKVEILMMTSSP